MQELLDNKALINDMLARYGVRFGIYKNGNFKEQLFPFDAIPRVIPADQFAIIEKGLIQRVKALNYFLQDVYGEKKIIKDGVVAEEFVFSSSGYLSVKGFTRRKGFIPISAGLIWLKARIIEWRIYYGRNSCVIGTSCG